MDSGATPGARYMGRQLGQQHSLSGVGGFVVLYGMVGIIRMGEVVVAENER